MSSPLPPALPPSPSAAQRLPPDVRSAFSQRPDYLLEHGAEVVANLTAAEREELLKTTRAVVAETMKHALAKPDALLGAAAGLEEVAVCAVRGQRRIIGRPPWTI